MATTMQRANATMQMSPASDPPRRGRPKLNDTDYIARLFARTICGSYKQDIAMLLQGPKGSGKSHASLRLAYNTARRVAETLDGDWHEWPKYFSMKNVAIIDPTRAFEIMGNAKPNNVYIYDDIGVGWNARAFATKENRDKNDIFQINRIAETVQIMSMPNQMLIDKVPRMLCNYAAEMDRAYFSYGVSTMRFFKTKTIFRMNNKQMTPHLVTADGEKVVRYVIARPPEFLSKQYDATRSEVTKRIIAERARQIAAENMATEVTGGAPLPQKTQEMYERAAKVLPQYEECVLSGMSHKEALKEVGLPRRTWYSWRDNGVLEHYGIGGSV